MKKLIIPTLVMSAFAGSNAVADPIATHFQGTVIKSTNGVHWYLQGRDEIKFDDYNLSSNPDQSADYVIHPKFSDNIPQVGSSVWQNFAMMTTNMVYPNGSEQSMPFRPNITLKIGDEQVLFNSAGISTNDVTYQDAAGITVTWPAGDILEYEGGIAWSTSPAVVNSKNEHQVLQSVINNNENWHSLTDQLKYFHLDEKAFGSDKTQILASVPNTSHTDFWNGSNVPKIGGTQVGYDFAKMDKQYSPYLAGNRVGYAVQRYFTSKTPTVTIPDAAFKDGKATYQATISITSASV